MCVGRCLFVWILYSSASSISAGNESCPQPQTSEHLAAIEIMKLKHILILQNKIDLVKESQAKEQYDQILKFVQGTCITSRACNWVLMLLCDWGHELEIVFHVPERLANPVELF